MTLFWSNHFVSSFDKVYDARAMWDQVQLYRSLALGNFRTLCHQMALTVAMLEYLDNATNAAGSPNQNFARELIELMTLGPGNYTEADVDASARAWTGHGIDDSVQPRRYVFRPTWHDNGTKTFFGTTKNWDGPAIIDEILDNPAKRTIMARFICRKLWGWFAYAKPADAVINGLADVFVANNLGDRAPSSGPSSSTPTSGRPAPATASCGRPSSSRSGCAGSSVCASTTCNPTGG